MKKKIGSVIFLSFMVLFLIIFLFPSICFSEKPDNKIWELYGKDSFGRVYYYNKINLIKSSNIISAWSYTIESNDSKKAMVERWKNIDREKSVKYQHYNHTILGDEFDCEKKLKRRKEYIWYDDKENVIDQYINKNSNWTSIVPESIYESLYKKICVTPKQPLNKK
jgi:hypothetical protein